MCPFNIKFAPDLNALAFACREAIARKDAGPLANDILPMSQEEFSVASRKSPMERATPHGLRRNAAVVLVNSDSPTVVPHCEEPLTSHAGE